MEEILYNKYLIAFLCSLVNCGWMLFAFKNAKDAGSRRTWKVYWRKSWDNYLASIAIPQFLVFIYPIVFTLICDWIISFDNPERFFNSTEKGVAAMFGLFGVLIYTKFISKFTKKVEDI